MSTTPGTAALEIRGLVKRYRRGLLGHRHPVPAADGVDLEVRRGEVVALVGESGSGKTTLARCALALLRPDAGTVTVLGTRIHDLRGVALDRFRRRVQPLFQDPDAHLNPGLTVREILAETCALHRPGEDRATLLGEALDQVGLAHRVEALPHELSGGERRRVGIARLLLCRPELVIADEPTAALDAARKAEIMDLILAPGPVERAALVISHDLPLMASCAHRMVVMVAGRVVERLPVGALLTAEHHPYTSELLAAAGLLRASPPTIADARGAGPGAPGCPLAGRCTQERPECATVRPPERALAPDHVVACHAVASQAVAGLAAGHPADGWATERPIEPEPTR